MIVWLMQTAIKPWLRVVFNILRPSVDQLRHERSATVISLRK